MYFRIHAFSFEIYAKQHQHFNADSINIYKKKKKKIKNIFKNKICEKYENYIYANIYVTIFHD